MPYKGSKADSRRDNQDAWNCVAKFFEQHTRKKEYVGVKRDKLEEYMQENKIKNYRLRLTILIKRDGILYETQDGILWLNRNIFGYMEKGEEVTYKKAKTYSRGISNTISYSNYYPKKRTIIGPI